MVTSRTVDHYLHLRQQGIAHERAVDHTRLRFGILPGELSTGLSQARRRFQDAADLIPDVSLVVEIDLEKLEAAQRDPRVHETLAAAAALFAKSSRIPGSA